MSNDVTKPSNEEVFFRIGFYSNIHFFLHTLKSKDNENLLMTLDVYNTMFDNSLIEKNQTIVVYNIVDDKIYVTVCRHLKFFDIELSKTVLKCMLLNLLGNYGDTHETLAIFYNGFNYTLSKNVEVNLGGHNINDGIIIEKIETIKSKYQIHRKTKSDSFM